jgi:hypothetical protein
MTITLSKNTAETGAAIQFQKLLLFPLIFFQTYPSQNDRYFFQVLQIRSDTLSVRVVSRHCVTSSQSWMLRLFR